MVAPTHHTGFLQMQKNKVYFMQIAKHATVIIRSISHKGKVMPCQDIAHIYVILHCNHFIILSKATGCGFAKNDEMTEVEYKIDAGNILTSRDFHKPVTAFGSYLPPWCCG